MFAMQLTWQRFSAFWNLLLAVSLSATAQVARAEEADPVLAKVREEHTARQYAAALDFCREEAKQGNPRAAVMAGIALEFGCGAAPDWKAAAEWYQLAALEGDGMAAHLLSSLHQRGGANLPANAAESQKWQVKAKGAGFSGKAEDFAANPVGKYYDEFLARRTAAQEAFGEFGKLEILWKVYAAAESDRRIIRDEKVAEELQRRRSLFKSREDYLTRRRTALDQAIAADNTLADALHARALMRWHDQVEYVAEAKFNPLALTSNNASQPRVQSFEGVKGDLSQAVTVQPDRYEFHRELANLAVATVDQKTAVTEFQRAAESLRAALPGTTAGQALFEKRIEVVQLFFDAAQWQEVVKACDAVKDQLKQTPAEGELQKQNALDARRCENLRTLALAAMGDEAPARKRIQAKELDELALIDFLVKNLTLNARQCVEMAQRRLRVAPHTRAAIEPSLKLFDRAIQKDPKLADAFFQRANTRYQLRTGLKKENSAEAAASLLQHPARQVVKDLATAEELGFKGVDLTNLKAAAERDLKSVVNTEGAAFQKTDIALGKKAIQESETIAERIVKWNEIVDKYPDDWKLRLDRLQTFTLDSDYRSAYAPIWALDETQMLLQSIPRSTNDRELAYSVRQDAFGKLSRAADQQAAVDDWLAEFPESARAHHARGSILMIQRNYPAALAEWSITDRGPSDPRRAGVLPYLQVVVVPAMNAKDHVRRADAFLELGDSESAVVEYDEAIELLPTSSVLYSWRAARHLGNGAWAKAEQDLQSAFKWNPDCAEAYICRGALHQAHYRLDEALADYSKAIELNYLYREPYRRRAVIHFFRGDLNKAFSDFADAVRTLPDGLNQREIDQFGLVEMNRKLWLFDNVPVAVAPPAGLNPAASLLEEMPKELQSPYMTAFLSLVAYDIPAALRAIEVPPSNNRELGEFSRLRKMIRYLSWNAPVAFGRQAIYAYFTAGPANRTKEEGGNFTAETRSWWERLAGIDFSFQSLPDRQAQRPFFLEDVNRTNRGHVILVREISPKTSAKQGYVAELRRQALDNLAESTRLGNLPSRLYNDPLFVTERQAQLETYIGSGYLSACGNAAQYDFDNALDHLLAPWTRFPQSQAARDFLDRELKRYDFLKSEQLLGEKVDPGLRKRISQATRERGMLSVASELIGFGVPSDDASKAKHTEGVALLERARNETADQSFFAHQAAVHATSLEDRKLVEEFAALENPPTADGNAPEITKEPRAPLIAKYRAQLAYKKLFAPESPVVFHWLGIVEELDGKPAQALAAYDQAIKLWQQPNPETLDKIVHVDETYFRRGELHWRQGDVPRAVADLVKFSQLDSKQLCDSAKLPTDESAKSALMRGLWQQAHRNWASAKEELDQVEVLDTARKPLMEKLLPALSAAKSPEMRERELSEIQSRIDEEARKKAKPENIRRLLQWGVELNGGKPLSGRKQTDKLAMANNLVFDGRQRGDPQCEYYSGEILTAGVFDYDYTNLPAAFAIYAKAGNKGHQAAQARVAEMYAAGVGVRKDAALAADWLERSKASRTEPNRWRKLRFDGIYRLNAADYRETRAIRFYQEGVALAVNGAVLTNLPLLNATSQATKPSPVRAGVYTVTGETIKVLFDSSERYEGVVNDGELVLKEATLPVDKQVEQPWYFWGIEFHEDPDAEQPLVKTLAASKSAKPHADPQPHPASAKPDTDETPPKLRFDGLYTHKDGNSFKHVRLYEDGAVLVASTDSAADIVASWMNKLHKGVSKGTYKVEGATIKFTASNVDYEGKFTGKALNLKSHSRINGHRSYGKFVFEPVELKNE